MQRLDYQNLTDERVHPVKTILLLSWPVLVEQILTTLVSYADTAMVGALGAYATASVSISNPVFMLINGAAIALGVGLTALLARSVGAKEYDRAKKLIRHAILLLLYIGLPLSLGTFLLSHHIPLWMGAGPDILDYATSYNYIISLGRPFALSIMIIGAVYRGYGDTRTPMLINLGVNVLNVVGNYLLINQSHVLQLGSLQVPMPGAGLGVNGAAIATAISQFAGGTLMVALLFIRKGTFRISLKESYRLDWTMAKQVMRISLPAVLERITMSTAGIVVTSSVATLGTAALAANTLYLTAESLSFMPGFAFATAVTTLVGQALGAQKPKLAEKFTYVTNGLAAATLTVAGAFLFIFARAILSFFTPDQEVIAIGIECLQIVAFLQPIQVTAWVYAGALRGAGDTKWTFYITAVCTWLIRTLGSFLCIRVFGLGLREAVLCMFVDSTMRAFLLFLRFRKGSWKNFKV